MNTLTVPAYAKINLFLRVVARLETGYHMIRSLVVPVGLFDEVTIKRARSAGVSVRTDLSELKRHHEECAKQDPEFPGMLRALDTAENLAARAAALLLPAGEGINVHIKKRIPLGAGLGGGSANAGAVLLGIKSLFGLDLSASELATMGLALGSDVPACVLRRPVFVFGTGGKFTPLVGDPLSGISLSILKPPVGVSTARAYRALAVTKIVPASAVERDDGASDPAILELLNRLGYRKASPTLTSSGHPGSSGGPKLDNPPGNCSCDLAVLQNDFEGVVADPEIHKARDILEQAGCRKVLLAGSGSSQIGFSGAEVIASPGWFSARTQVLGG